jgi:crotonobetainyl-CoA:carnitine CoA-transferase CaiB-like acyl-CoA transferase
MGEPSEGFLSAYRVLDLSDEKGIYCGKLLADLGADVIAVEPPGGGPARRIGPFYKDSPHPERSLFWFAYGGNKRSITLDITTADGRDVFARLAASADIVVESFAPGRLKGLGLGYDDLCRIKPDIILTSITPYGQNGPYKDSPASDLACWCMGGFAYLAGDQDRPPVQISFPLAYLSGASEGAAGTMVALYHRELFRKGQQVDVSIQASVAKHMMNAPGFWQESKVNLKRAGQYRVGLSFAAAQRVIWKCKDGEIAFFFWGGKTGVRTNGALVAYMDEEGLAPEFMKKMDWAAFDSAKASDELFGELARHVGDFFLRHTKAELFREAVKRRMTLYPVQTVVELSADAQLRHRDFWEEVDHPQLGASIRYPKLPAPFPEGVAVLRRRAPFIGEHNEEIYLGELGYSKDDLAGLKAARVI